MGESRISGSDSATVKDCYATAAVSGNDYVGGVVGNINASSMYSSTVINCYATGTVSGSDYVGGVVGANNGTLAAVRNCVALNSDLDAATNYGRVGVKNTGTFTNNYGRMDMTYAGGSLTWSPATSSNNQGITIGTLATKEWNDASWWTSLSPSGPAFNPAAWIIADGKLPTLKDMPGRTQNPVVQ